MSKLPEFDIYLVINNFCDRFICDFSGVSKQIPELFCIRSS